MYMRLLVVLVSLSVCPAVRSFEIVDEFEDSKLELPSLYMTECRLMELFSQEQSFFTKVYPANPESTVPTSLPYDLKKLICRYLFAHIRLARITHGETEDTLSFILKQKDLSFYEKLVSVKTFLALHPEYNLQMLRLPYDITILIDMILNRNADAVSILKAVGAD